MYRLYLPVSVVLCVCCTVYAGSVSGHDTHPLYRLFTYPPAHQLAVLDELARIGFKVMYEVGRQLDSCGDPIQEKLQGAPGLCFNDSTQLAWLRDVVH